MVRDGGTFEREIHGAQRIRNRRPWRRRAEAWERTLLSLLKTKHELTTCREKGARDAPDYRRLRSPLHFVVDSPPHRRDRDPGYGCGSSRNRTRYTCPCPPPGGQRRAARLHPTHCPAERFIKSLPGLQYAPASRRIPLLLFLFFDRSSSHRFISSNFFRGRSCAGWRLLANCFSVLLYR